MSELKAGLARFVRDEGGEDLIEYGLLAAFAAAIATAVLVTDPLSLKPTLVNAFKKAKTALDAASPEDRAAKQQALDDARKVFADRVADFKQAFVGERVESALGDMNKMLDPAAGADGLGVDLAIADAVAGVFVDLVERHALALRSRRIERNRAGNQGELEIALPIGAGCHAKLLRYD